MNAVAKAPLARVAGGGLGLAALVLLSTGCAATGPATDPSALHDPGPAIRVTVGAGCPATLGKAQDVSNSGIWTATALLPPAIPTAGLICRYGGRATVLAGPLPLYLEVRLDAGRARALADAIADITLSGPPGVVACPAMFSSDTVIAFSYYLIPDADLGYSDTGCATLDNGTVTAFELADVAHLIDQLAPFQPTVPAGGALGPRRSSAPPPAATPSPTPVSTSNPGQAIPLSPSSD